MFSDELEMLIDAAIADGEISEKERAVLHKRAQAEGVDIDELNMIINARIIQMKNNKTEEKKKNKTALQTLIEKLEEIKNTEFKDIKGSFWKDISPRTAEQQRNDAIYELIEQFYIPTNKEELIELITYFKAQNEFIYRKRYKEMREKANLLFPGDEDLDLAINGPKKEKKGFFGFGKKS